MRPESRLPLSEIAEAAAAVEAFCRGKSLTDLAGDDLLRSAVYMKFVLIGEAVSKLRRTDPETAERISEAWKIAGFRNLIVHGYAKLDDEVTWQIVHDDLPTLRREVTGLLRE